MTDFISERVGGMEIQTYLIAKHLSLRGWKTFFIASTTDSKKTGRQEDFENFVVCWVRKKRLFSFFRRDIHRLLSRIQPSVIYQRGRSWLTSSPVGYRFKNRHPFVYHCAEDNDLKRYFNFEEVKRSSQHFVKKMILYMQAILSDYFFRQTLIRSDRVIVQTRHQMERFQTVLNRKSHVIPSAQEVPGDTPVKTVPPIVFWIAHAGRRKRLELFVQLARELESTPARFIFAGTLPHEDYKKEIFDAMSGLSNIEYLGPLTWEESEAVFAKASVFVNTTLPDREGFPNTYIQAWLRETPVVTLNCDPDGVTEKNGIGFHSRSFEQMVRDVRFLLENQAAREQFGRSAKRYASEHHDIRKTSAALDELLTTLIN